MRNMNMTQFFRQQDVDGFADHFIAFIAEHPQRLTIDECYFALFIDNNHGVRCGLQQISEKNVRLAYLGYFSWQ